MLKMFLKATIICGLVLCLCITVGCTEEKRGKNKDANKTKVYSATASIIVTTGAMTYDEDKNTVVESDFLTALYLANTVVDVLKIQDIYEKLADELGGNYSAASIKEKVVVARQSDDSLIININVYSEDAEEAILIANKLAEISEQYIPEVLPNATVSIVSVATDAKKSFLIK